MAPSHPDSEAAAFAALQASLAEQFRTIFPDPRASRTVVVLPSLTLDPDVLAKVTGVHHYEERMLGMLMLLRLPRTRLIYLTSQPIPDGIIDYYLQFLQGVPGAHARARLTLLSCHDGGTAPLTQKLLARPRLLSRLADAIGDPMRAHLTAFMVTELERSLALRLGIPLYGCGPELRYLGTKSGGRKILREAGCAVPDGIEDLRDAGDLAPALEMLQARNRGLRRAVVKLNEGFSGDGNALFSFDGAPEGPALAGWIADRLPSLRFEAQDLSWEIYREKLAGMGGVCEVFIEGADKRSPSAQFRVDPLGDIAPISTHDQVLGGPSGQVFLGCRFPADPAYRLAVQDQGCRIAAVLRDRGVLGRFGVDFVSVDGPSGWQHFAIEINLRKGGTTHPMMMLQFLTGGIYRPEDGSFCTPTGQPRFYRASDNLESVAYRGLTPDDLVDTAVMNGLHYDGAAQEGVVFHLIGALSEFGKLGVVCVGGTPERADALYDQTVAVLQLASG